MSEHAFFSGKGAVEKYSNEVANDNDLHVNIKRGQASVYGHSFSPFINNSGSRTFVGHDTNISVKSDYNRNDFEWFRPSASIPRDPVGQIAICMEAYKHVGIIRNIIDLMSDFSCQGIKIQHPNKATQRFYEAWFKKVSGKERSERFLNYLYRVGNVVVRRSLSTLPSKTERKWKARAKKGGDSKFSDTEPQALDKKQIPIKYTFFTPLALEVLGDELANFIGQPAYGLKINQSLKQVISNPNFHRTHRKGSNPEIQRLLSEIPSEILAGLKAGDRFVPLDMDRISTYYYKKDDWNTWAVPLVFPIIRDIMLLDKMKLADMSALDGAISNVRLWTIGVLDGPNSILPTKAMIQKLRTILANNVGGGVMDLVWGPELKFEESNSQVWRWLGSSKYEAVLGAIYEGMGVPSPLRVGGSGGNNTGAFVGLNTMVKRLQYGRDRLVEFWNNEIALIHEAFGFKGHKPTIVFDHMVLADEAAERQLWINLWDRDIIPTETLLEVFGRNTDVETARIKNEAKDRGESLPHKASPYHNPEKEHELKKIALQGGDVAPSEVGLELEEKKEGETTRMESQFTAQKEITEINTKNKPDAQKNTGVPGRPNNVKETTKRKQKPTEKPSTKAAMDFWATKAQEQVADIANPALCAGFDKESMRQLTKEETALAEQVKFAVLCNLKPFSEVDDKTVYNILSANPAPSKEVLDIVAVAQEYLVADIGRELKLDEVRRLHVHAYVSVNNE